MRNKVISSIGIFGLFFVLAIVDAQAQRATSAEVSLPFDFTAGSTTLKAGRYSIKKLGGNVISIRSADGAKRVMVDAPLAIGARDSKGGTRLVFNRYGDLYFLAQVWLNPESGRQVFPSKSERKARDSQLARGFKPERLEISVRGN
jgi:hypothetical protein